MHAGLRFLPGGILHLVERGDMPLSFKTVLNELQQFPLFLVSIFPVLSIKSITTSLATLFPRVQPLLPFQPFPGTQGRESRYWAGTNQNYWICSSLVREIVKRR